MRAPHPIDDVFQFPEPEKTFMQHPLVVAAFAAANQAYNRPIPPKVMGISPKTAAINAFLEKLGLEIAGRSSN